MAIPNDRGPFYTNVLPVQTLNSSSVLVSTTLSSVTTANSISSNFTVVGPRTIGVMSTFIASANTGQRLATLTGGGGGGTTSTPTQSWYLS